MNLRRFTILPALAIILTGCSSTGNGKSASEPATTEAIAVVEPTQTPDTPEQLASVIAGQEVDWRDTIDEAGDCRFTWVSGETDLDETYGLICYMQEKTIVMSSANAARDLRELTPPDSMVDLYDETLDALDAIASVDLSGACGEDSQPDGDEDCNGALGALYGDYNDLETVLDKWGPYL